MIALGKQIFLFLWYCSTKEPHQTIADRFNVTKSSFVRVVQHVCEAILEEMLVEQIKWPQGGAQQEVGKGIHKMNGMEQVIGAIDGCHNSISGRDKNNEVFINRKQSCQ